MNNFRKKITIKSAELWDEDKQEFINTEDEVIEFEHSLAAIADWESRTHKHFLGNRDITPEEMSLYLECMCVNPDDIPKLRYLTPENMDEIKEYLEDSMTATKFYKGGKPSRDIITSEIIYYWMAANQIPIEFEHWHISRLLTLLRVCSNHNEPQKKMSQSQIMRQNAQLNAARRAKLHSKG